MSPARVKQLLWYEVWGSLDLLVIGFGVSIAYGGPIGSDLIAPATVVALVHGLLGAGYVYAVQRAGHRDLIRFPLWVALGFCIGIKMTDGYSFTAPGNSVVGIIAWGGIIASLLGIGWVSLVMPAPAPQEEGCCLECGYDLSYCPTRVCPECGHEHPNPPSPPQWGDRSSRPWRT